MPKLPIPVDIRTGQTTFSPEDDYEWPDHGGAHVERGTLTALPTITNYFGIHEVGGAWLTDDGDRPCEVEEDGDDGRIEFAVTHYPNGEGGLMVRDWVEVTREDGQPFPEDDAAWPEEPLTAHTFSYTLEIALGAVAASQVRDVQQALKTALYAGLRAASRAGAIPDDYIARTVGSHVTEGE